jgi:hypothetical protein
MAIAPNTGNYTIGKGKLYIAEWVGDTPPSSYIDLGNAPVITIEHAIERLPHYSSQKEYRAKDKNIVLQKDYIVNFTLDEISAYNLQIFLQGTRDGASILGLQSAETEYALKFVADNPAGPNRTYEFWRMTLTPSGSLSLIGEEWMQLAFTGEGLADTANHSTQLLLLLRLRLLRRLQSRQYNIRGRL